MKLKNAIAILVLLLMLVLCAGFVCASQQDSNMTADKDVVQLEDDGTAITETNDTTSSEEQTDVNVTSASPAVKTEKIQPQVLCGQAFVHKKSNYMKVKLFDINKKNKYKFYKNVNLTVKVKIGKNTNIFKVKTDKNGEAKVFNVKNLKIGTYKVSITTNDSRYQIKEKDKITVYGGAKKTLTVKMKKNKYATEGRKKLKNGDTVWAFYEPRDAQYDKGVYVESFPTKNPLDGISHNLIIAAKFVFKNKKTGKLVTKTAKLTPDSLHGWELIKVSPVKGYEPVKVKVWYLTR